MYQIGDTVMHPSEGVCCIKDIRPMCFTGGIPRNYYVLHPSTEKASGTVYLPVERGDVILRRLLSRDSILETIHASTAYAGLWTDDARMRKERFAAILHEGNHAKCIQMIREIHEHDVLRQAEGKKLSVNDAAVLHEAERLLHQEFSYVLKLNPEETVMFILQELGVNQISQYA